MIARQTTKGMLERVFRLVLGNPRRMAGRSLILAYHNVVPDELQGRGDVSLHLPLSRFLGQIDLIQAHCNVRPLADLLAGGSFEDGPRVAVTFDDAYRGAVELALPELDRRGIPCTLFVAPGLLGSRSFWWDELALEGVGLPEEVRRDALERQAGRQERIRSSRGEGPGTGPLPECYACASKDQVRALARLRHVTLGAHSWSHPNLTRIEGSELTMELSRPLDWLGSASVPMIPVLAYPYGLCSPAVEAAAAEAGYAAALLVQGGWFVPPAGSAWTIPRYTVPAGLSVDGLMLRLSGRMAT
jgi:peptidoglycan/xylan/chitin deacetylase (PgdA/CDA1 family)